MKNQKIFISVALVFSVVFSIVKGQQYDDYYYGFDEKVYLTTVNDKYVIEFPVSVSETLFSQYNLSYEKLKENVYSVESSLSSIQNAFGQNFYFNPVYQIQDGPEIYITRDLILKFKPDVNEIDKANLIAQYGLELVKSTRLFSIYQTNNSLLISKQIYLSGLVEYCLPDFICEMLSFDGYVPNDEYFAKQWYLLNEGQLLNDGHYGTPGADIKATKAWEISKGNEDIAIAVIDRGVTSNHPDLPNTRQLRLNGSNFTGNPSYDDPSPVLPSGRHGNPVAGIIAATQDNNEGISGVAPLCKIMPIVIPLGKKEVTSVHAEAITFAHENGAHILNNSWGALYAPPNYSPPIVNAIRDAIDGGTVVIFAAGNYNEYDGPVAFPANADVPFLLAVGASDRNDEKAFYSAIGKEVDVSAPSNTAGEWQIPGEAGNVWTIDLPGEYGYNPWPFGGNTTLPTLGEKLPDEGENYLYYTGRFSGTSAAAPQVAGCAALALSVNPNLSVKQINNLVKHRADRVGPYNYSWNHLMPDHSKELGYGRLNCYRMVKTANDMQVPGVDLYIRDLEGDFGIEPNEAEPGTPMWISPDIWVRNQNDGTVNQVHENPAYSSENPVYVYVRVHNKGEETSTGNERLYLYWAKAGTDLKWPEYWTGGVSVDNIPMGGELGDQNIPVIETGEETILTFAWPVPNPEDYYGINGIEEPWHFCLLARIVAANDPMTFPEGPSVNENTFNNNNIAWKNVTIVDPLKAGRRPGGVISIGNTTFEETTTFELEFEVPKPCYGNTILDEAEVRIILDEMSYNIWSNGGHQGQNIEELGEQTLLVTDDNAQLQNLTFEPGQWSTIYVHFNFLTQYATTEKTVFEYMVTQRRSSDQYITGGELYIIHKPARPMFQADAGSDKTVSKNEMVTLSAQSIGEDAEYNWYNSADSLIHTGTYFWVTPDTAQKYRLEVIALADGFKDYDEVTVNVKQYEITGIAPNPTTGMVTISYDTGGASSANLLITNPYNPQTETYTLDLQQNHKTVDLSHLPTGVYGCILVCNGQFVDQKLIVIF
jgi:serine protease